MILDENVKCPKCNEADEVIPIIYSCSVSEYEKYRALEKKGKCLMAGCVLSVDTPKWYCKRCKNNIWKSDLE